LSTASLFSYNIPFTWFLQSCNRQALELFIKGKIQPGGKNKIETKDYLLLNEMISSFNGLDQLKEQQT